MLWCRRAEPRTRPASTVRVGACDADDGISFGASGNSVGLGIKGQTAKVEVDGGFEVLPVAVSASGNSNCLHP